MNIPPIPDDFRGPFFEAVWEIARQIPPGRVMSYGQIAALIPSPANMAAGEYEAMRARWAGQAMSACPKDVPWQRVVNSQGKISLRSGEGVPLQRRLLEAEGVQFDARERINLGAYGWPGPARAWLIEKGLLAPPEDYQQPGLL